MAAEPPGRSRNGGDAFLYTTVRAIAPALHNPLIDLGISPSACTLQPGADGLVRLGIPMKRAVTSVVASALLAVSFTSTAAPIRMTAEGVVFNSAYPGVEVGDPWTLEVIFDPATMTLFEQIGDTQAAYTPLQSFALTLGPFRLEDTSNEWLVILDDHLGGLDQPVDTMLFEVIFSDGGGVLFSAIYEGGGPITSLDLPTDVAAYQPIFDGTTNRLLTVFSPSVDAAVGAATSVRFEPVAVSEAGTLGLVCASLVGLLLTHAHLPSRRRPSAVRQVT